MTDPTGIDSGAPALLLTTSRALTAADPTAIDSGAPAILLTTGLAITNEVADGSSAALTFAEQSVHACTAAAAAPSAGSATRETPAKHAVRHKAARKVKPAQPTRTLAFTGPPSLLADAAVLALGGALWFSRRLRGPDLDP